MKTLFCQNTFLLPPLTEGTLYISDNPDVLEALVNAGYPAVALMHSGNHHMSFPMVKYILEDLDEIEDEDLEKIYRRIKGLPCDICETDRLLIRETTIDDLPQLYEIYEAPEITRYMENLFPPNEEKEYIKNYIDNIYSFYDIGIWSVIRKADNRLIGRMGLEYKDDEDTLEMGFVLGVDYQGQGYATEAGMEIIKYASSIPGNHRIIANVHRDNINSIKLCNKLGIEIRIFS